MLDTSWIPQWIKDLFSYAPDYQAVNNGTVGDGAIDAENGSDGTFDQAASDFSNGNIAAAASDLSGLEPWAIGAGVLIGLFLLLALVHEVREV